MAFFALPDFLGQKVEALESVVSGNVQTIGLQSVPWLNLGAHAGIGGGETIIVDGALLPDAGPLGTAADFAEFPSSSKISTYVVRPGDTLSEIAEMFDVSVNTVAWANDISLKKLLPVGQELIILPISGVRHLVAKDETLEKIAKKYKADAAEILRYNDLEGKTLAVGQTIIIPDGEIVTATGVASRLATLPSHAGYYLRPTIGGIKTQGLHGYNGVDLAAALGTKIMAAAEGRVLISKAAGWNGGYGNYVVIEHPNGTQTLYAHLAQPLVVVGQRVSQGQTIGLMGSTGRSTGSHLHFEIRGARNPF